MSNRNPERRAPPAPQTRRICLLAFEDAQILDITGPLEVFACADRWVRRRGGTRTSAYSIEIVGKKTGPVATMAGVTVYVTKRIREVTRGVDTLLVAGGDGVDAARKDPDLVAWLRRMAPRVRRLASVCNGALLLAEAGLLNGRRATTHWSDTAELASAFPKVSVEPDLIYVCDGNVYTSGGVTAGMDLALHLVEEDLGSEMALFVARRLVMFLRRPGGQSQFSQYLNENVPTGPLKRVQQYILDHPDADLSVAALAGVAAMSQRNFARVFVEATGLTPAKFVELARVEAARIKLEQTSLRVESVARACGFSHPETMRRAFQRMLSVGPSSYRRRFGASEGER